MLISEVKMISHKSSKVCENTYVYVYVGLVQFV